MTHVAGHPKTYNVEEGDAELTARRGLIS